MTTPDDWFQQLKDAYPKRSKGKGYNWPIAYDTITGLLRSFPFEDILQGTKNFCSASKLSGDYGTEFIPMASTFYNRKGFLDEYETEQIVEVVYRKPDVYTDEQHKEDAARSIADMDKWRKT